MREIFVNGDEALRAEDKALDALLVEDMSWVASKLDDTIVHFFISIRDVPMARLELVLELVRLHLQRRERFLAPLAVVRLIVHEELDSAYHNRVLDLAVANRFHE